MHAPATDLPLVKAQKATQSTQYFVASVGIDWGDAKHDFCLEVCGKDNVEFGCIPHRVECIDEWARALHQRFGSPIAVALELTKGPIVSALLQSTISSLCFRSIRRR